MARVRANKIDVAIKKILDEYGEEVNAHIKEATHKIALAGARELRATAKTTFDGTGKYAKGWRTWSEASKYTQKETIYNKSLPGLPHLLEHGHAKRGGGRVQGRAHIKPVEEKLINDFETQIMKGL